MAEENTAFDDKTFQSLELKFTIKNLTSRTDLKAGTPVRLCEWLEQGFILEVPYRTCGAGHMLLIEIVPMQGTTAYPKFTATCKVESLGHNDDATDRLTLTMTQFDKTGWQTLKSLYEKRQEELLKFLSAVRGYD